MSIVLRKSNGDLHIDEETGRGVLIDGPSKVAQELASVLLTFYNSDRDWGAQIQPDQFGSITSKAQSEALLFLRVNEAVRRLLSKQAEDRYLDVQFEQIQEIQEIIAKVHTPSQSGLFYVSVLVGEDSQAVASTIAINFKPVQLRHVIPPGPDFTVRVR